MTISLIGILVTLIIIGAILYIIQLLPIDATIKRICYVVVVLFVLLWLLQMLGAIGPVIRLGGEGGKIFKILPFVERTVPKFTRSEVLPKGGR